MNIKSFYKATTKQLSIDIEDILCEIDHDMLRGRHAEELLKKYLQSVLPKRFKVDTGLIIGINEENKIIKSKEVDIIVYDQMKNMPLQSLGGFSILPAEAVAAVISVKITANTTTLLSGKCNAFDNIKSVKHIPRNHFLNPSKDSGVVLDKKASDLITCVFAYKSDIDFRTFAKNVSKKYEGNKEQLKFFPEITCILDCGNIIAQPAKHELTINGKLVDRPFAVINNESLMIFTNTLVSMLNRQTMLPVDYFSYAYTII